VIFLALDRFDPRHKLQVKETLVADPTEKA